MTRRESRVTIPDAPAVYLPGLPEGLELPHLPQALCAEVDPELWFPEPGEPSDDAKEICSRCPERKPCLSWALAANERYGVWGGLTTHERDRLVRRRRRRAA